MEEYNSFKSIIKNLQKAIELPKCKKCGCMKETLETMKSELSNNKSNATSELLNEVENSIEKMESVNYT